MEITLKHIGINVSLTGVWHLVATEAMRKEVVYSLRPDVAYPQLYFMFHLQRKPHYYLITITLPCIFLTFIALLVRIQVIVALISEIRILII